MKFTSCVTAAVVLASNALITFATAAADYDDAAIREDKINYPISVVAQNYTDSADGVLLQGFLSTPNNTGATGPFPAVVILHDSSGADTYEQQRATMIANELGYVAFAADIFGVETDIPIDTGGWGGPYAEFIDSFRSNATFFTQRIVAAVDHVQSLPNVDATMVAVIGYCLGGTGVLHYINVVGEKGGWKGGGAAAAVSIHPTLFGEWEKPLGKINTPSLFLTGGKDFLTGPQAMATLEDDMTNASTVEWETNRYAKIDHAFSNWFSETSYNARADERSWTSMKTFLADKLWQRIQYCAYTCEAASYLDVSGKVEDFPPLSKNEGGAKGQFFTGDKSDQNSKSESVFLAYPYNINTLECGEDFKKCSVPAVVILPDKSGDQFSRQRAVQIAKRYGYAALVADDYALTRQLLEETEYIDSEKVALEGYGNGGQDALGLAMGGWPEYLEFKVISSFQVPENLTTVNVANSTYKPQILFFSGVDGDNMADVITLENTLIGMDANYELNRYSDAQGNFADWNPSNNPNENYYAAARSFESIETIYLQMFGDFPVVTDASPPPAEAPAPVPAPAETQAPAPVPSTATQSPVSGASVSTVTTASSCLLLVVAYILSI